MDGHTSRAQCGDPSFVVIDADDPVAHLGEAGRNYETHVSGTNYTN
jgi:hypothetical protein